MMNTTETAQTLNITLDLADGHSIIASGFEDYAQQVLGLQAGDENMDLDASEAGYAAAIAREYEQLAGLPSGSVEVEFRYGWPYPIECNEYDAGLMELAQERASGSNFWVLAE